MIKTFEYFMHKIIDYAGLFPPANLGIKTALSNYRKYMDSSDNWMLGRFIIPADKLKMINPPFDYFLSVILADPNSDELTGRLQLFAPQIKAIETRLPDKFSNFQKISNHLHLVREAVKNAGIKKTDIFMEASAPDQCFELISALNKIKTGTKHRLGFKLRCGGLHTNDFPAAHKLAKAIKTCKQFDIPIKFTAGLHHAVKNYSDKYKTMQYGFINVFSAALLSFACNLSEKEVENCLVDENFDNFVFTETDFSWKNQSMSANQIKQLRREKVIGFGSCSFEEPRAELKSLGLLSKTGE